MGKIRQALRTLTDSGARRASLEMKVSRLRNWLELPEAVHVAGGRVALNPQLVWSNVGAFDAAVRAADADAALAAYRGPHLQGKRVQGLALRVREQFAHRQAGGRGGAARRCAAR